ncbi:MAG: DUF4105 domain-containing protein [Gemmatimonadaceae bacterium]
MRSIAAAVGSLFLMSASLGAQPSTNRVRTPSVEPASTIASEPGAELTVYLLTMGPGDQVWEKFGHNAIWIHDAANSTDIAYHWGVFAFGDKDFYPNFIRGKMRYLMGAFDFNETIDSYRQSNRTVWAQELNLTPAQRYSLAQFVAWNVRPENRYYRYDYYRDNCSTRVRDALDGALGGVIKQTFANVPTSTTYRFHTERLTQDDWPIFTGTMAGLGQPTDRPITAYEEMFLPVKLKDHLQAVRISSNGASVPLVKSERVLVQATRAPEDVVVRRGLIGYVVISLVVLILIVGAFALQGSGEPKFALSLIAVWNLIAGLSGILLTGLWAFTDHVYSYRNENLFQLNPLSLVVLVLVVRLIVSRQVDASWASTVASARRWSSIVAALSVAGFLLQILPIFRQVNGDIIALAMPIHVGVAAVLVTLSRRVQSDARTIL